MKKLMGAAHAAGLAFAILFAAGSARAEVIVNNIFSPFTTVQIVPGHRYAGPPPLWIHNPRYHQRCFRHWSAYFGTWHHRCERMRYWGSEPYWN